MTELLFGIRVIKYSAWEKHFEAKVESYRSEELRCLKSRKYLDALCVFLWASSSILVSLLTFTTYVLLGNNLTAAKVGPLFTFVHCALIYFSGLHVYFHL